MDQTPPGERCAVCSVHARREIEHSGGSRGMAALERTDVAAAVGILLLRRDTEAQAPFGGR